jgi:exonuclease III
MDDAMQGMLFAGLGTDPVVDDAVAQRELRLCTLNVSGPKHARAPQIVNYLLGAAANVIVLTEMRANPGADVVAASLDTEGFRVTRARGWRDATFHTLVATKGFDATPVDPAFDDPRVVAADLTSDQTTIRLVGVYAPTNGMTAESSTRRARFQEDLLDYLASAYRPSLWVTGDLNVIEPDHQPPLPAFEPHDYDFYRRLQDLGLSDAYRAMQPDGADHSWFHPHHGSQRLDHALIGPTGTLRSCHYDQSTRQRELSDHAALHVLLDLPT